MKTRNILSAVLGAAALLAVAASAQDAPASTGSASGVSSPLPPDTAVTAHPAKKHHAVKHHGTVHSAKTPARYSPADSANPAAAGDSVPVHKKHPVKKHKAAAAPKHYSPADSANPAYPGTGTEK